MCAHALTGVDAPFFPCTLDMTPLCTRKPLKDSVCHVDLSDGSVEVAVGVHQHTALRHSALCSLFKLGLFICERLSVNASSTGNAVH